MSAAENTEGRTPQKDGHEMKLAFGSDHAGFQLKNTLIEYAKELGHEVEDFGSMSGERSDYPDFGYLAGKAVADGRCDRGVVICYTGIGISITANKVPGIRCALCSESYSAFLTRAHNDSNMLAIGAGFTGPALAKEILRVWLSAEFEGGRHKTRVDKIMGYEARGLKRD